MPTEPAKLIAPLWAYQFPPSGISAEWEGIHQTLIRPAIVVATFQGMPDAARSGNRELYQRWLDKLRDCEAAAMTILQLLRARSPRTWRAGHAILTAISPISTLICSAVHFLTRPTPTRAGNETTTNSLGVEIADKLSKFEVVSFLDELAKAVAADCTKERQAAEVPHSQSPQYQDAASSGQRGDEIQRNLPEPDLEALAIALLFQQPDWSVAAIADSLQVDRKTPYKWETFRKAAELCGRLKPRGPKAGKLPQGHKTRDGTVDAFLDESEEE